MDWGATGDVHCVLWGRGEGRVLLNEQSQMRCWRSINQVHQKGIRSVSVRRCRPAQGGGQAEERLGMKRVMEVVNKVQIYFIYLLLTFRILPEKERS